MTMTAAANPDDTAGTSSKYGVFYSKKIGANGREQIVLREDVLQMELLEIVPLINFLSTLLDFSVHPPYVVPTLTITVS